MNRRQLLQGSLAASVAASIHNAYGAAPPQAAPAADAPFSPANVRDMARALAAKPYVAPDESLPDALTKLTYDQYRSIRFRPDHALWHGENRGFEAQFFHRGFFYKTKVDIFEVADGLARPIKYQRDDFTIGEGIGTWPGDDLGFAGFRLHAPINKPDYYDEVCVFLGASYFRAVAKDEVYGLSARGLAVDTGESKGEEFPFFKAFWLERPALGATSIVINALLDSKSASGSFRFTIRPGATTMFDVEMALYPRADMPHGGLAPLTSMYFFGSNERAEAQDFRPEVHDSDGLAMRNGKGEELWRPLSNPHDLQVSAFEDLNPRAFGLMQRQKSFAVYQDLESHFERRPSLSIEPIGDWGEGAVVLFEIPTKEEVHDNIVAFWRPKEPAVAKREYTYTYRMHWGPDIPKTDEVARFVRTGVSALADDSKQFVLEIVGDKLKTIDPKVVKGAVSADKSTISNIVTQPNPETGGWRLSFQLATKDQSAIELRASLMDDATPLSEVWIYRWTP